MSRCAIASPITGVAVAVALAAAGCSHVVVLKTEPPGATVYIDGEIHGVTPIFYEEATGWGRSYQVRLVLPGYHVEQFELAQNVWWPGCVWPSLCLMPVTCGLSAGGLLFARSLRDDYTFMLRPLPAASAPASAAGR
ncbi:MAG: PEGA domain-containing protein [Deltaproteobacteria bacterium]|nr:PEGA domain-containing protein [Deltaproteobacteria bacterium]